MGLEIDIVADLRLGLLPQLVRLQYQRTVIVIWIRGPDCPGLAVGGAAVVEEVELLEQEGLVASLGCLVRRGAAHDSGTDDYHVELLVGRFHLRFLHQEEEEDRGSELAALEFNWVRHLGAKGVIVSVGA